MINGQKIKSVRISGVLLVHLRRAIKSALLYERETGHCRKLGITGEVGEVLACHQLKLKLPCNPRSTGYDAIDKHGKRVQIKTRRSEGEGLPRNVGRSSSFSKHEFDYALLVLLDHDYSLCEIWRTESNDLRPIIEQQRRRNPPLASFKRKAERIFPKRINREE